MELPQYNHSRSTSGTGNSTIGLRAGVQSRPADWDLVFRPGVGEFGLAVSQDQEL